jgi:hypothetical protein
LVNAEAITARVGGAVSLGDLHGVEDVLVGGNVRSIVNGIILWVVHHGQQLSAGKLNGGKYLECVVVDAHDGSFTGRPEGDIAINDDRLERLSADEENTRECEVSKIYFNAKTKIRSHVENVTLSIENANEVTSSTNRTKLKVRSTETRPSTESSVLRLCSINNSNRANVDKRG